jgi:hypothetical protein
MFVAPTLSATAANATRPGAMRCSLNIPCASVVIGSSRPSAENSTREMSR